VEESLGDLFESEERFMGHLTIARVKNVRDKKEFLNVLKEINIPRIKFKINEFYLMSSVLGEKGPKYSVIEKYKLI
jgi:2'-5' RNA ligase